MHTTQEHVDGICLALSECDPATWDDGIAKVIDTHRTYVAEKHAAEVAPQIKRDLADLERAIRDRLSQLSEGGSA